MADGNPTASAPMPVRRDLHFRLPADRIHDWNGNGGHSTQYMNALSIFFPEGERFFIHSVRHYRDRITDPVLQQAVAGFIGQEAMHGREHSDFNQLMADAGLPTAALEKRVTWHLERTKRLTPPSYQLAATIALEHLTAILGNQLLTEPEILDGAEPHYARLWRWHALEETEHKAVAFDVWKTVMKPGLGEYLLRVGALIVATLMFSVLVASFYRRMVKAAPRTKSGDGRRLLRMLFLQPGLYWKLMPDWFAYFKPRFHPWQQDNREFLKELPQIEQQLRAAG